MIEIASERANALGVCGRIDFRVLPTEDIAELEPDGPFDGAFSNFSGLNCVEDLFRVARSLARLLKPDSRILVCMRGRFVPWELLWFLAHGEPKKAMQRFQSSMLCSQDTLQVQHFSVAEITRLFAPELKLRKWTGIGIAVPPSYMEHWARRFPKITNALAGADRLLAIMPVCRSMADCVLLEFERGSAESNT